MYEQQHMRLIIVCFFLYIAIDSFVTCQTEPFIEENGSVLMVQLKKSAFLQAYANVFKVRKKGLFWIMDAFRKKYCSESFRFWWYN